MRRIRKLIPWVGLFLAAAALFDQLNRPADQRTWNGTVFGVMPYDFRVPTLERIMERWWNPNDERIFTPDVFGVGWSINLYQLRRKAMLLIA